MKNSIDDYYDRIRNLVGVPEQVIPEHIISGGDDSHTTYERLVQAFKIACKAPTIQQKMDTPKFTLTHIESLFGALSLSINDPAERQAFDTMFKNWRNDRLSEF